MIRTVSSMDDLEKKIREMEMLHDQQMAELKMSAAELVESLSPSRILNNVLQGITHSPAFRSTAITTAIGMGAGFLGKKLFLGHSENLFKKITGTALQFLVTNFISSRIPVNGEEHKAV